jgi:hypothetical protein
MPSVIGDAGYNGLGGPASNYLKAKPSTRFATRQLAFFTVTISNVHVNYLNADSLYSRAIRAVQQNAEIYAVGLPAANDFVVVVAQDTANDGANTDDGLNDMADTLSTATGGTVTAVHLAGDALVSGLMAYSNESLANSTESYNGV